MKKIIHLRAFKQACKNGFVFSSAILITSVSIYLTSTFINLYVRIENELSVREAELEAEQLNQGKKIKVKKSTRAKDPYVQEVEDKFLEAFGTKVEVKGNLKKGKLVIQYSSRADLERLYKVLGKSEDLFE